MSPTTGFNRRAFNRDKVSTGTDSEGPAISFGDAQFIPSEFLQIERGNDRLCRAQLIVDPCPRLDGKRLLIVDWMVGHVNERAGRHTACKREAGRETAVFEYSGLVQNETAQILIRTVDRRRAGVFCEPTPLFLQPPIPRGTTAQNIVDIGRRILGTGNSLEANSRRAS